MTRWRLARKLGRCSAEARRSEKRQAVAAPIVGGHGHLQINAINAVILVPVFSVMR